MQTADLFPLPEITRARANGHAMGDLAAEKAERLVDPDWTEKAVECVRRFARHQAGIFNMEMCRLVIQDQLPQPPGLRSWGAVTRLAKARGFIQVAPGKSLPAVSSNGSEKTAYRKGPKA